MAPKTEKTGTFSPPEPGSRIYHCSYITWNVLLCEGESERDGCIDEIDRQFLQKKSGYGEQCADI